MDTKGGGGGAAAVPNNNNNHNTGALQTHLHKPHNKTAGDTSTGGDEGGLRKLSWGGCGQANFSAQYRPADPCGGGQSKANYKWKHRGEEDESNDIISCCGGQEKFLDNPSIDELFLLDSVSQQNLVGKQRPR